MSSTTCETVPFSCANEVIMFTEIFGNQKNKKEKLQCYNESDSDYDLFAINTCRDAELH